MKRWIKRAVIGAAAVAALAAIILPRFKKKEFAAPVSPPVLSAEQAQVGDIRLTTDLIGTVEPETVVYIYPKASGDITAVHVKAGDYVSEGQLLCEIDTKQVDTAKNSMDSALVTLRDSQAALARNQALFAGGNISAQSLEESQNEVTKAQLQYDAAKINYENQLEFSRITSPIAGRVDQADLEAHDSVSQSNLLCVISGEGSKVVSFNVTERIRRCLADGDEVTMTKDGEEYVGIITEINNRADSTTGLFKVKAAVNDGNAMTAGVTVQLSVVSQKALGVMTIPVNSVYFDGSGSYVYTYEEGLVHKAEVESGIFDSERIQIVSGITADDLVVTTWSSELYEGAAATLKEGDQQAVGGEALEDGSSAVSKGQEVAPWD